VADGYGTRPVRERGIKGGVKEGLVKLRGLGRKGWWCISELVKDLPRGGENTRKRKGN